jgi:response regulator RpfG family c-di-GMP phosphodiesterase
VDDSEDYLVKVAKDLEPFHRVRTATSAAEALRVLETHGAEIVAVVSDFSMPVMNGVELLDLVAMHFPAVRRILCSVGPVPPGSEAHRFVSKLPPENFPGRLVFEIRRPLDTRSARRSSRA